MPRPFRPPKPLTTAQQAAAIRRLNAELGLVPHAGAKGLLVGVLLYAPLEPATAAWGRVEAMGLVESDEGSSRVAQVETGGIHGLVHVPAWASCAKGDRIALTRHRTPIAVRYTMAPAGCDHPR